MYEMPITVGYSMIGLAGHCKHNIIGFIFNHSHLSQNVIIFILYKLLVDFEHGFIFY